MWQFYGTIQYIEYCRLYTTVVEEPSFHWYFRKVSKIMNNFIHMIYDTLARGQRSDRGSRLHGYRAVPITILSSRV